MQEDTLYRDFLCGIAEFNEQRFYQCHETLEAVWKKQVDPERQFTQGLIQIAVAYYHQLRGNRPGARKLFTRGLARLSRFKDDYLDFDVKKLRVAVADNLRILEETSDSEPIACTPARLEILRQAG